MGRVYEALKRAAESNNGAKTNAAGKQAGGGARKSTQAVNPLPQENGERRPWELGSPIFVAPDAAQNSASAERTGHLAGKALSSGITSRVAGATADAVGQARVAEFRSVEVSAARVEPHLVSITDPKSPRTELYRSLRTRVLHSGERRKLQAFVITSTDVMEGKTVTTLNLAWLLAQTDGIRTLLIDGDLRQPCAADYLGLDPLSGLSEVLAGEKSFSESILRLEPAGLHLLPGGARRDDVAEMLSGPKFGALLHEARSMFDYILIDAPPLEVFTDASVLINRTDSALLVVRSSKTRYAAAVHAIESLPRERLLGVVLNYSDEHVNENSYYYQRKRYTPRSESAGEM